MSGEGEKAVFTIPCEKCRYFKRKGETKIGLCGCKDSPARFRTVVYDDYCPYGKGIPRLKTEWGESDT